jgi:hypothetical protein
LSKKKYTVSLNTTTVSTGREEDVLILSFENDGETPLRRDVVTKIHCDGDGKRMWIKPMTNTITAMAGDSGGYGWGERKRKGVVVSMSWEEKFHQ